MFTLFFDFGNERIIIIVKGKDVKFGSTAYGSRLAGIEGLKLNYEGAIKEHPDLRFDPDWKQKTIKRFNKNIKSMKNEGEIVDYVIKELKDIDQRGLNDSSRYNCNINCFTWIICIRLLCSY